MKYKRLHTHVIDQPGQNVLMSDAIAFKKALLLFEVLGGSLTLQLPCGQIP